MKLGKPLSDQEEAAVLGARPVEASAPVLGDPVESIDPYSGPNQVATAARKTAHLPDIIRMNRPQMREQFQNARNDMALGMKAGLQGIGRNLGIPFTNIDVSHGLERVGLMDPFESRKEQLSNAGPGADAAKLGVELGVSGAAASSILSNLANSQRLAGILSNKGVLGLAARGGIEGGTAAGVTGQGDPLSDLGIGAAAGAVASPVLSYASRFLTGLQGVSDDAAKLMKEGIPLTPGQAMSSTIPGNIIRATEESLTSAPFTGPVVQSLRGRGLEALREKAIGTAVPPGMAVPGSAGLQPVKALREIGKEFSKRYESALNAISKGSLVTEGGVTADDVLRQAVPENFKASLLQNAFSNIDDYITPDRAQFVAKKIANSVDFQSMSPKQIFKAQSDLRKLANKLVRSSQATAEDRAVSDIYNRAAEYILDGLQNGLPNGAQLQALRGPYRNYVNLLHETEKLKGYGETLSPIGIQKAAMKAKNRPLEDLARTGGSVLPSRTPDSGTAGRATLLATLGGVGGFLQGGDLESAAKGAAIGAGLMLPGLLMTTVPGSRFIYGQYPWQKAAAQMIPNIGATTAGRFAPNR